MRKVYTIGETVLDLIFDPSKNVISKAGGAMLNSSVSLGRLDVPISFITELGDDKSGKFILEFLNQNAVDISCCYQFENGQTAIALAFIDENENAEYSFYKNYPDKRMSQQMPFLASEDIVLFGSFFAITSEVRDPLIGFVEQAKQQNALIIYDPNFRKPHLHHLPEIEAYILENISFASIVRGSDEDFKLIFDANTADETFEIMKANGCQFLIYTCSNKTVEFRSSHLSISLPVPSIKTISTIGAGDNFNAGLIFSLYKLGLYKNDLVKIKSETWEKILKTAMEFGSHVCTHYDNYISHNFAKRIKN